MNLFDLDPSNPAPKPEPRLQTRHLPSNEGVHDETTQNRSSYPEESSLPPTSRDDPESWPRQTSRAPSHRLLRNSLLTFAALALIGVAAFFFARHWIRSATYTSLPQLDGSLSLSGLTAPVTIQRDVHGVPHIHAADLDDLVFAQGFVTAGDRLFQMDLLRRHAAGELAEILGATVVPHDRLQRTLQIRAAADRAVAALPLDQLHLLQSYARGVNASIERQAAHLPVEFRVLRYQPAPWSPRDSLLVSLAMFEDLTNTFSSKLARESLIASLRSDPTPQTGIQTGIQTGPELIPELIQDLYPVGSWRDHPPTSPEPDLTVPGPPIEQVPLDESQSSQTSPGSSFLPQIPTPSSILASLQPLLGHTCLDCNPGSNNWVVSGTHTASGKPLLSNDMHLNHTLPGIWYEADLKIDAATSPGTPEPLRVAGLSLPGLPLIVVGHNAHIAWGFTNLGADVQDVYLETLRSSASGEEFHAVDGSWQPVLHIPEIIKVHGGRNVTIDVTATSHGNAVTPILNPILIPAVARKRTLSLRWTLYDPTVIQLPLVAINSARDWPSFLAGFASFGGPAQNVVYADDAGHIGYHAVGRIPLRGSNDSGFQIGAPSLPPASASTLPADIASPVTPRPSTATPIIAANPDPLTSTALGALPAPPSPLLSGALSPVPLIPTPAHEWSGYIPFDQLPQVFDPPGGVIASANSRTTADDYHFPITLDWAAPYRNERIWRALAQRTGLTPADMLAIQLDVYSDFDHVLAQRLAYALDNTLDHEPQASAPLNAAQSKTRHQAADLLRNFNGRMAIDSPAAAVVSSIHAVLWPMLLAPHLDAPSSPSTPSHPLTPKRELEINQLYTWGEKDYALEQILMHTPPRWLPPGFTTWDDFLAAAVDRGLREAKAPTDLSTWRYGSSHTVDIEHPLFGESALLRRLLGLPTGTNPQPQSGDATTVKQVGHSFGPSERFTADLGNPDHSTLNIVLGQSGNPASPWFLDQFGAWYRGNTFLFPFTEAAVSQSTTHTLTLTPQ